MKKLWPLVLIPFIVKPKKPGGKVIINYEKVMKWKNDVIRIRNEVGCELTPAFILAIVAQESGGDPDAKGKSGEIGLMQVSYVAYSDTGVPWSYEQIVDPLKNLETGIRYIKKVEEYLEEFDVPDEEKVEATVKSYNIGIGNYLAGKLEQKAEEYWRLVHKHRKIIITKYWS